MDACNYLGGTTFFKRNYIADNEDINQNHHLYLNESRDG